MGEPLTVRAGDLVQMRKLHACGANQWAVVRAGVDVRIRCLQCGRVVLLPRTEFLRAVRKVSQPEEAEEPPAD
jgi:hypothetical protein